MITQEGLKQVLEYDEESGWFFWILGNGRNVKPGDAAGTVQLKGVRINIGGTIYKAHHLAWLYVHGHFPEGMIDHANGDCYDNRIENLRIATNSQNVANNNRNPKGAYQNKEGKWVAQIRVDGFCHYLGIFDTYEQAHDVFVEAHKEHFGQFSCFNREESA
jgi:hypothetical protein